MVKVYPKKYWMKSMPKSRHLRRYAHLINVKFKMILHDIVDEENAIEQCWIDLTSDVLASLGSAVNKIEKNRPKKLGDNITLYFNQNHNE